MERSCDFCVGLRPVVFCEADAAHLCFPCDSKVHSANALSKRHPRILICELCRIHPAYARCADHQKFVCRGCDQIHHDFASEHKKQVITSYTGCPSVKELAEAWRLDLNDVESSGLLVSPLYANVGGGNVNVLRQFNSQIGGSSVVSSSESLRSSVSDEHEVGSGNSHIKANKRGQQFNNSVVWQQVPDLRKFQPTEGSFKCSKIDQDRVDAMINDTDFLDEGMTSKPYSSLFSQVDQLADILNGDSFWQSKNPFESNQVWSQNMQDLGFCDELRSMDNLSMPDVDLTFQNYEELFKGEEEPATVLIDDDKITTRFDSPNEATHSPENSCNSTETEGIQFDSGETVFIRHKDKKGSRHETQAGYTSYRKLKSVSMKRVKSKGSNTEGSEYRDANDVMTRNF